MIDIFNDIFSPAAFNLFGASRGGDSVQPLAFQTHDSAAGADPLERFSSLIPALEPHSLLHSGSSSPVNSENSVFSSGSEHLVSNNIPIGYGTQKSAVEPFTDSVLHSVSFSLVIVRLLVCPSPSGLSQSFHPVAPGAA